MAFAKRRAAAVAAAAAILVQPLVATPSSANAVVGYIKITMNVGQTAPTVVIAGVLNVPTSWTCTQSIWNGIVAFEVTCVQIDATAWQCSVLHADAQTLTATGIARTSMFCDGTQTPAAQTRLVSGAGDWDWKWAPSGTPVQQKFRCRVDNGVSATAAPLVSFRAFCGDPPALALPVPVIG